MQYKCDFCQDTGSLHHDFDLLDCRHCDATTGRIALDQWLASQYKQAGIARTDSLAAWRIHQRALAMAPKQEAQEQKPVAYMAFADNGNIRVWAEKDNLGAREAAERMGMTLMPAYAAPAAANGAMPELPAPETMIVESDIGHRAYSADQMRAYGQARAAAGPNAALVKDAERYRWLRDCDWFSSELCVLRSPKTVLAKTGITLGADCPSRTRLDDAIDVALSGAKGN